MLENQGSGSCIPVHQGSGSVYPRESRTGLCVSKEVKMSLETYPVVSDIGNQDVSRNVSWRIQYRESRCRSKLILTYPI